MDRTIRIAIVGGALQGMEAVYLAKKAGFKTVVLDRRSTAPALSLADESHVINPINDPESAKSIFGSCDVVLPACEESDLLNTLVSLCKDVGVPFLFDIDSYNISCSKVRSNEIMSEVGAPLPRPWPDCGFPVIVKPSSQSGSVGVSVAMDEDDIRRGLEIIEGLDDEPVIQEFVHGKSVSIEVIGDGKDAISYVTTEVILDSNYDCKMVVCDPDILSDADEAEFGRVGKEVAGSIGLKALMDVEAILTPNGLRILEIDARIPSQTPAAIEKATGVNLLRALVNSGLGRSFEEVSTPGSSVYYHLFYKDGVLRTCGEKEFGHVDRPSFVKGLFGSDDAITDYEAGKSEWRATLISGGESRDHVMRRVSESIDRIRDEVEVLEFIDVSPDVI